MQPMTLILEVDAGEQHELTGSGPLVLGRARDVDIPIKDLRVSRHHGTLIQSAGVWSYSDNSSTGTYDVAGRHVQQYTITEETRLILGAPDGVTVSLTPRPQNPAIQVASRAGHPDASDDAAAMVIGRSPVCDVIVDDLLVSREHARIERLDDGTWLITDLDSANGTYVAGARQVQVNLNQGTRVSVGSSSFIFDDERLRLATDRDTAVLEAQDLRVVLKNGATLLRGVSLSTGHGSLSAVVGPSGAGKSTLLRVLTGQLAPSSGRVEVMGEDLYLSYEQLRSHLGHVPQDDIVHTQLSARSCLRFGAELRFPEDVEPSERDERVEIVLEQLGLTAHADKAISKLSGGQRKRVSVALELLTEPDVLLLDEPTTGLDPGYEQSIMKLLREIADTGRAVVVVTHAVASLELCDQVVFLGSGGRLAFVGRALDAPAHFGVADFPEVFQALETGSDGDVSAPGPPENDDHPTGVDTDLDLPVSYPNGMIHQLATLVRRQTSVLISDPRTLLVYLFAAVVPAALLALIADRGALNIGDFGTADARMLVGAMVVTVSVLGVANGAREIVKELPGYRRERAAGLRRSAYLFSKLLVLGTVTVTQAVLVVLIATVRAGGPDSGTLFLGRLELMADLAMVGLASLAVGLLISAIMTSSEKAVAAIPLAFVVFWLFSGTVSDLAETPVLSQMALLSPSNWGTAAAAGTVDLLELSPCPSKTIATVGGEQSIPEPALSCDRRWERSPFNWLLSMVVLVFIGAACLTAADVALARKEPLEHLRRRHLAGKAIRAVRHRIRGVNGLQPHRQ